MKNILSDYIISEIRDKIPTKCSHQLRDESFGGTVFNTEDLKFLSLDTTGYELFKHIDGKKTVEELLEEVRKSAKKSRTISAILILAHLKSLKDKNFIKIDDPLEYKLLLPKRRKYPRISAPNQVSWLMTSQCNLNCTHCGNSSRSKKEDELTNEEARKMIRYLKDNGVFILDISGGEPLMREDAIELFMYARSLGLEMGMTSNGTLIDDKMAQDLKKVGMYNIHISLDGIGDTHDKFRNKQGTFDKVENAIKLLKKHKVPFGITTSVCKMNYDDLDKVKAFVIENKIRSWEIYYAIPIGCMPKKLALDEKELVEFSKKIEEIKEDLKGTCKIFLGDSLGYHGSAIIRDEPWDGCMAGINHLAIDPEGNIKGCPIHPKEYIEGNIRKDDLIKIWRDENSFSYNRKPIKMEKHCGKCEHKDTCRGGCKALMYCLEGHSKYNPMCLKHIESKMSEAKRK